MLRFSIFINRDTTSSAPRGLCLWPSAIAGSLSVVIGAGGIIVDGCRGPPYMLR